MALALALVSGAAVSQTNRLLLVGDSWAAQQWSDQSHELVFSENGLSAYAVVGEATTISGSTAAEWTTPSMLALIEDELVANPDVDTVQLTLGGNDFLDAWQADFTDSESEALQQAIQNDLQIIVDFILQQDPDIEVLLSFYDYPNFVDTLTGIPAIVCLPLWNSMNEPTPMEINSAAVAFENAYAELATAEPRVHHVSHVGLMQFHFGFPDEGIAPGEIPLPGDPSRPSPIEAMRGQQDCFHLSAEGYDLLVQNLVDQYLMDRLDTVLRAGFEG